MKLAAVNIMWILFSVLGLFVFGFFPATFAMFTVVRKWIRTVDEFPIFNTFWEAYKSEFIRANGIGHLMLFVFYFTYINARFLSSTEGLIADTISVFYIGFIILLIMMSLYIFPVFCHYKIKTFQYITYAFMISVTHPLVTILMVIAVLFLYYMFLIIPGITLFFSGSGLALVMMWLANFVFIKLDREENNSEFVQERVN